METLINIIKSIIILLKILFFGESVLLTQSPINVEQEMHINLDQPISALTGGAFIEIDITDNISMDIDKFFLDEKKRNFYKTYYPGCISVTLHSKSPKINIDFVNSRALAFAHNEVFCVLNSKEKIPLDIQFDSMTIQTCSPLKNIKIIWQNSSK